MAKQQTARPAGRVPGSPVSLGACVVWAVVCGVGLCALMMVVFSWLLCHADLPLYAAVPLATAAVSIGAAGGGMVLARMQKKNGLLLGFLSGLFFFVVYALAALLGGQREFTAFVAIKLACFVLAGCLGGYLGLTMAERKTRRRPKT